MSAKFDERLAALAKRSAEAGAPVVFNASACCRSCVNIDDVQSAYNRQARMFKLPKIEVSENSVVWSFAGQGMKTDLRSPSAFFLNHPSVEVAQKIVEILEELNIEHKWDNDPNMAIQVL